MEQTMPRRTLIGVVLTLSVAACAGTDPAASVGSVTPPTAAPSTAPAALPSELSGPVVELSADSHRFDRSTLEAPADRAFHIVFTNDELLTPHNIEIEDAQGEEMFFGTPFEGEETRTYDVPALPAGTYTFVCTVHPEMRGTLVAG
jgi:plastocyanin